MPLWIAEHGQGWLTYPRNPEQQRAVITRWRSAGEAAGMPDRPVIQSLYVDVLPESSAPARPIHLGFQSGTAYLIDYLHEVREAGVNHVALNLRLNRAPTEDTLQQIAQEVLPLFHRNFDHD